MDYTKKKPALWKIITLCLVSAMLNQVPVYTLTGIPLYLDTVFTIAVFFSLGLIPAIITGIFLHLLFVQLLLIPAVHMFVYGTDPAQMHITWHLFVLCIIVEILLVHYFHKRWLKGQEAVFLAKPTLNSFIGMVPLLLMLTALVCIAVSITGGIIGFFLTQYNATRLYAPEYIFIVGLLRNNISILASAILSRIPINTVDRFFVIFGGYGISLLYRKWLNLTPRFSG